MTLQTGYSLQDYVRDRYDNQLRSVYNGDDAVEGDIVMRAQHRFNRWDNLTLTASFTLLDAEYVNDNNASLIGYTPAGASDVALSLWSEYQFNEGGLKGLSLQGGRFYESDRPVDDANSFDVEAYHRFDLGLKYVMPLAESGGITYSLTASNVFD
ncbi:TonB-dependent receptor [Pelagicoccus sp. SDUM812002]|uniref:TonB-dependent receptor domain-containing protein n=1 Tax=Pelagicoccus sp. SDUM812002 TaxID=3041266 RepID=UPI00280EF6A7|nr:TonB-dependent receptor [Pelagicoccus sp. SDUM812002]MDQ8183945.1 TonB-dependent receptor [Pelagicoccus sp. SDUM812002]